MLGVYCVDRCVCPGLQHDMLYLCLFLIIFFLLLCTMSLRESLITLEEIKSRRRTGYGLSGGDFLQRNKFISLCFVDILRIFLSWLYSNTVGIEVKQ